MQKYVRECPAEAHTLITRTFYKKRKQKSVALDTEKSMNGQDKDTKNTATKMKIFMMNQMSEDRNNNFT